MTRISYFNYVDVVCFDKSSYSVKEGGRLAIDLTLSAELQHRLTVPLEYIDIPPTTSESFYSVYNVATYCIVVFNADKNTCKI